MQDFKHGNRVALGSEIRVREGDETAVLRWGDTCSGIFPLVLRARDTSMFAAAWSPITLRSEAEFAIDGFHDADLGIDFGREHVLDVDFLAPLL